MDKIQLAELIISYLAPLVKDLPHPASELVEKAIKEFRDDT